ncbi:hypothetical protein Nepgr_004834 [Nepenthes gracilis]|uniref:Uncharacterized protein n=1 Tax=Nepenthes gracilis TaxID=150966 RepID=A0AAD3S242_NEPGR|nr:hypothetical protein Nepgr_004834 [Nepenthes gracilis]
MSLALLQGYSSAEEGVEAEIRYESSSDDSDNGDDVSRMRSTYNPILSAPKSSRGSALPSAFEAFSEISRPPEFLNNSVEERSSVRESFMHRGRRKSRDKKDIPAGAVVEAKAQLVGIHERVRSDIDGNFPSTSSTQPLKGSSGSSGTAPEGAKRVSAASNPDAEDAAQQLRLCLQCGVPKTYSSARGLVCPVCGDHPPPSSGVDQGKRKGSSTIKDKEKIKRMRGQSSHATWKSETEMQLRQQFD